ncbi:hypothetical protein [Cerasicoccus maritimus]|uniref:hypothetical protein n=1 Tax=Cerasicoccus maritimus TaxID=490089 RepID=UPI002852545C|nr:hypothetical protein [Cerasicoccus maritimus]
MTSRERYVVLKGSNAAGLGDRLLALCSALAYAKLTGRTLVIDWRDGLYGQVGQDAFSSALRLVNVKHSVEIPKGITIAPPLWRDKLDFTFSELVSHYEPQHPWDRNAAHTLYSIDQGNLDYQEDIVVIWDYEQFDKMVPALRKHLRRPCATIYELRNQLLREHLRPTPPLQNRIDRAIHEIQTPAIGLHVRATQEGMSRYVDVAIFEHFLEALSQRRAYASIFLASDNIEIVERLQQNFSVTTTQKWYPAAWEPMHLSDKRPDKTENLLEAMTDIYLLASCQTILYSLCSSFGHAASLLSECSEDEVYLLENLPYCRTWKAYRQRKLKNRLRRYLNRLLRRAN